MLKKYSDYFKSICELSIHRLFLNLHIFEFDYSFTFEPDRSTSPRGGNQVDGLPPALSRDFLYVDTVV